MQRGETEFSRIFESGKYLNLSELSDSNIRTDDGCNFAIHRVILATSSDYFRGMFLGMGERRRKFHIPGISGECLSEILRYIYTEDIQVTERNITGLIIGADYMLLGDLQKKIHKNIADKLTEDNCLSVLLAAHQIGDEYIFRKCFRFIQTRFEGIMRLQKDELADLPLEVVKRILSNRSLYVYNETTVWKAIVAWTQKDIQLRMACVPQLLLTLSTEDEGEELAMEILQHKIISENCYTKDLVEITSSNDFTTNLKTLLDSYSNRFAEPIMRHRSPLQLFILWFKNSSSSGSGIDLYITYDENTDFRRKIAKMSCYPDVLISIRHNIYIFNVKNKICMKFDLIAMDWVRMECFSNNYRANGFHNPAFYVLAAESNIYVLGIIRRLSMYSVEVYDTVSNRWSKGVPLRNIDLFAAVVLENKIYGVGQTLQGSYEMTMQMFDSETKMWSTMSPPMSHRMRHVCSRTSLVAYHQKIYLIVGSDAEVFDPATNLWNELPPLLDFFDSGSWPKAVVIHDQIIVGCNYVPCVRWNNVDDCWEALEENKTLNDIFRIFWSSRTFCTVDDFETIRTITKQNRNPEAQMEY